MTAHKLSRRNHLISRAMREVHRVTSLSGSLSLRLFLYLYLFLTSSLSLFPFSSIFLFSYPLYPPFCPLPLMIMEFHSKKIPPLCVVELLLFLIYFNFFLLSKQTVSMSSLARNEAIFLNVSVVSTSLLRSGTARKESKGGFS